MALVCLCDGGCGKSGDPSAFVTLGVVIKRQYCEACATGAERFVRDRDDLHTQLAAEWREKLATGIARFRDRAPTFKLPDVADPEVPTGE